MSESTEKTGFFGKLMALPNDDPKKTVLVAVLLCLACSVMVSTAAVALKSQQIANQTNDIRKNILAVTGQYQPGADIDALFENFEVRLVELETGEFAGDEIDPATFDQRRAARSSDMGINLSNREDIAGIGRKAKYARVYILRAEDDSIEQIVLPVHGYGLWSTMYGFLSLESDINTISGLRFYDHAETPGLGGEIDNPRWRDQWEGKKVYNEAGDVEIRVMRGFVDRNADGIEYKVDGLSGATLTSNGVSNMMEFWMGEQGFKPFVENMRAELGNN